MHKLTLTVVSSIKNSKQKRNVGAVNHVCIVLFNMLVVDRCENYHDRFPAAPVPVT